VAEIGIAFQTDKPPGRYGELAAAAEAYGFDVVSVFADLLYQPPLPALLEMARATTRVRLGAACLNPYTQHPYEIAGGLAALEAASGGRAYLGLARGTWLEAIGIDQSRPLAHLRDTAAIVHALLSGDDRGYCGAAYWLAPGIRLHGRRPPPGPDRGGQYLAVVADLDPTTELPAGFAGRVRDLVAGGQDEAAGALIPDEVLDRFAFSGTPEHVAALAQRVLDAGAGRVDFGTPHGLTDDAGVALLGTAVLPRLQHGRLADLLLPEPGYALRGSAGPARAQPRAAA
jgi:alkanesulfonate monooxygenase SsuD/methylene tetrahydromethanopterin reductase-like flavin-dependent oxidoreductase (luciferase family)